MRPLASILLASLAACTVSGTGSPGDDPDDTEAAEEDAESVVDEESSDDKADLPGWGGARTLHEGDSLLDFVAAGDRRVHALWADASPADPISIDVAVSAAEDSGTVRVAVLGPLRDGQRQVVAADGYTAAKNRVELAARLTDSGQHLVVIGSFGLETDSAYQAMVRCAAGCDPARVDVLAAPKAGGLVGAGDLIAARLGGALAGRTFDVEMEVWSSPPGLSWAAEMVGVSVASGDQVNALVPDSVKPGDDIILVVREAGGAVLDTGVLTRHAPGDTVFARLDAILYGDLVAVTVAGVTGFFEGTAELELRSEETGRTIESVVVRADRPGQIGNGLGAFDATFAPWISDEDGNLNPDLPRNGDLLSVGRMSGNGDYLPFGCFEYCNDLSGDDPCTGGPRSCY
ncbi:MAG TPA: hypothetical protein VFU21_07050 [Kofleriaceae bacterium]|nr:hypothetical protein [Kofleriaceae bacterium]